MATFKINDEVSGSGFYPDIEANSFKKVEGYFYFVDDQNTVVDCIGESFVRRIRRVENDA